MTRFLKKKMVLISGGNGGIGLELTKIFLSKGYTVHTIDISKSPIVHENLVVHQNDLLDSLPALGDVTFDYLVLNVGYSPGIKSFDELTEKEITKSLGLNIIVHLRMLKKYSYLKAAFIGSVCGMTGLPDLSMYAASKAFMSVLFESLRREGKKTYIIYPYKVNTNMFQDVADFCTLDKTWLANIIVRDIEGNIIHRVTPSIFSLFPFFNSIIPSFILDWFISVIKKVFYKTKKDV